MNSLTETLKQLSADGTGVNLEILKGQHNFNRWARDFQAVAQAKGVWDAINGSLTVVEPPDWDQYTSGNATTVAEEDSSSKKAKRKSRATLGPDEISKLQETTADGKPKSTLDLNTRLAFYKFDLDSYEKYEKKTSQALALLVTWVDPIIRGKLQSYTTAYHAFEYLKQQYKMSDVRAQELANNEFENIHMSKCSNVQEYLNHLENARLDITDVGGHCDDAMMSSKIIRGLTEPFYPFVDQYHFLRDLETNTFDLGRLTTRLLTYESDLRQRAKPKNVMAIQGNFGRRNSNLKCGTCNKIGHTDDRCWTTHPELKKSPEEFRSWKRSQDQRKGSYVRGPERAVAMTQLEQADRKPKPTKRFAAMTQANLNELHSRIEACESLDAITDSKADPRTQADVDKQRMKELAKGDCQGGHDGGSSNDRRSQFSVPNLGVQVQSSNPSSAAHKNTQNTSINTMMLTQNGDLSVERDDWILDGGANTHVVNDKRWFAEFYDFKLQVATADDGNVLEIKGGGTVELHLNTSDGNNAILELSKVAYAPNVRCNILSQSALGQIGNLRGFWNKKGITIETQEGETVAEAMERDGMYYLDVRRLTNARYVHESATPSEKTSSCLIMPTGSKPPLVVATIDFRDPVWKWHRRLGHMSFENLRRLLKVSEGMKLTDKQIQNKLGAICPVCATSRAVFPIPRDPATRRYQDPGDLIHVDAWGPYAIKGIENTKGFVAITDEATRFVWAEPYKTSGELVQILIEMIKRIERTHKMKVRRIRMDNEFARTDELKAFLSANGITSEPAASYHHYQNGVAERNFRTQRERTAAMIQENNLPQRIRNIILGSADEILKSSTIPEKLWPEAWKQAMWLKNRTPTRATKSRKTPWELLHHMVPDLTRERIWGSRTYVTVPPERRGYKLHRPRGWMGYFMGCVTESIYRIWNPEKDKIVRVSAVRIDDGEGLDDPQNEETRTTRQDPAPGAPTHSLPEGSDSDSGDTGSDAAERPPHDEELLEPNAQNDRRGDITDNAPPPTDSDDRADATGINNRNPDPRNKNNPQSGPIAQNDSEPNLNSAETHQKDPPRGKEQEDDNSNSDEDSEDSPEEQVYSPYFSKPKQVNMTKRKVEDAEQTVQPSENKCTTCAKKKRRCDGVAPFSHKCSTCTKLRTRCYAQGAEPPSKNTARPSKEISSKRHTQGPDPSTTMRAQGESSKAIPTRSVGEKCTACAKGSRRCNGIPPFDEKCSSCAKLQLKCYSQGAEIPPRENAQPIEEKCENCATRSSRCDGVHPFDRKCSSCEIQHFNCRPQGSQPTTRGVKHEDKCAGCRKGSNFCNGERPCQRCISKGKKCYYTNGDEKYSYQPNQDKWEQPSEPSQCSQCQDYNQHHFGRSVDCDGPLQSLPIRSTRGSKKWIRQNKMFISDEKRSLQTSQSAQ